MTAKKVPVVSKTAAVKKMTAKKAPVEVVPVAKEIMQLYTIRLLPSVIAKLEAKALKLGTTHAQVARDALAASVARGA